jgi:hypothetical protein
LQRGQYTISMSTDASDISRVSAIHLSSEEVNAGFLAIATSAHESGRNYLDIANIDGTYVKSVKNKALRASTEPAMAVPFSMAAGS